MKFIIFWLLNVAYPTGCGSPPPTVDEFGRVTECHCSYASMCYTFKKEPRQKVFHNADSANVFYEKVLIESRKKGSDISSVRMEQIKITEQ